MKRRTPHLLWILFCGGMTASAHAQAPDPPAAPLPSAITKASKLFLGNAGTEENADCLRAYNDFYQGLAALGHYGMVFDPKDADLVLELHYEIDLGASVASNDGRRSARQFRVVLVDPRSRTVLWSLTEHTNYALFQSNRNKNLDETVAKLVADFASLTAAQPPNNNSRVHHSPF